MKIQVDDNPPITWEEFCAINPDDAALLTEIKTALEQDEVYHGGGGAAARFTVHLVCEHCGARASEMC